MNFYPKQKKLPINYQIIYGIFKTKLGNFVLRQNNQPEMLDVKKSLLVLLNNYLNLNV